MGILAVYSLVLARGMIEFSQYRSPAEIFPFYHWDLFSRVPEPVQDYYGIRFTRLYGAVLDEPIYYEDSVLPNHQSSSAHALVQRLGAAVVNGDEDRVSRYQTILESRYLEPLTGAEYELVDRRYDIAERLECDCYIREDVIAQFTMGAS